MAAKEELRWSSVKSDKVPRKDDGVDGRVKQIQDFHEENCCSGPAWNQKPKVSYFDLA